MTTSQLIAKTRSRLKDLQNGQQYFEIINEQISRQGIRIFEKGIAGDGRIIGEYSDKPIVIGEKEAKRKVSAPLIFVPFNASQRTRTGKKGYYGYSFPGGYGDYKRAIGRGSRVNLNLFGNFQTGFLNGLSLVSANSQVIKFRLQVKPSVANPEGKIEGLLERYPRAFKLTKGEHGFIQLECSRLFTTIFGK